MQWSVGGPDGCRVCLVPIAVGQPRVPLFAHETDKSLWTSFLLDSMGLRVSGATPVPQHLCARCHRNMRNAFDVFLVAKRSTNTLQLAHEKREKQQRLMSRNGDGAAGLRPSGIKKYFVVAEAAEIDSSQGTETTANMHHDSIAEDDEAGDFQSRAQFDIAGTPSAAGIDANINSGSDAVAMQTGVGPSNYGDPPRVTVVRREDVMSSLAVRAGVNTNFAANRLQDNNRGFQLLQRTGWTPGDTIGRKGDGIEEPIAIEMKNDRRGLGVSNDSGNAYLTHPLMFNYLRQLMLKNGSIDMLVFGRDFDERELRTIRGCAGRMRFGVHYDADGTMNAVCKGSQFGRKLIANASHR